MNSKTYLTLVFAFFPTFFLLAQCPDTSSLNLLPKGDFGQGTDSLSTDTSYFKIDSNLTYTNKVPPNDGFFTIANSTSGWLDFAIDYWINTNDNSGDPNGYMLVINQGEAGIAYETQLSLCPDLSYAFSLDAINLFNPEQTGDSLPALELWINDALVADLGELPKDATWHTFVHSFTTDQATTKIQIRNTRDGGFGNDYALDNIQLRLCVPDIILTEKTPQEHCPGDQLELQLENIPADFQWYYQLQVSINEGRLWTNVGTQDTATSFNISILPPSAQYRVLMASAPENIFNSNCRYATSVLEVAYADPRSCNEVIKSVGELCTGARGDNIFENGDFGSGSQNTLGYNPGYAPGYSYQVNPPPNDGSYTITNNTSSWGSFAATGWLNIGDNSNDPNGYMMVVNASYEPGIFYQQTVPVCENTNYEFSADVISVNDPNRGTGFIEPNISFLINGIEIYTTGDVPVDAKWHTYGFTFTTRTGVEAIQLTLRNNAPGGFGNDLALDNISFRPCGPGAYLADTTVVCGDEPLLIPADVELTSDFPSLAIQWQFSSNQGLLWQNLTNENNNELFIENPTPGSFYRLKLANNTFNLDNSSCQFFSNYTVISNDIKVTTLEETICEGQQFQVGDSSYTQTGFYRAAIPRLEGCDSIVTLDLLVNPTFDQDTTITICEGFSFPFGENRLDQAGFYQEQFQTVNGCDSTVRLDFQVAPIYNLVDTVKVCYGETYEGRIYFGDTLQTRNLISLAGCDSTVSRYFEVLQGDNITLTEYVCPGDSYRGAPIQRDTLVSYGGYNGETCDTVSLINVRVYNDPPVQISGPDLICQGDTAVLSVDSYPSYSWSTGANTNEIKVTEEGNYKIEVISENNCLFRDSIFLEVPNFSASLSAKNITCFDANDGLIDIVDLQDAQPPFSTMLNGKSLGNQLSFDNLSPGLYSVELTDQNGCQFQEQVTLTEPDLLTINIPTNLKIDLGQSTNFKGKINRTPTEIIWTPSEGLSCSDCLLVEVSPAQSTTYTVIARDSAGCEARAQLTVDVNKNRSLYVPSAFSPNGDEINDLFFPFDNNNVEEIRLWQVIDRWGNLIFEAQNTTVGSSTLQWDGQFRGQPAPVGVYLWRAIVVYKDQQIRTLSGDVLLMR